MHKIDLRRKEGYRAWVARMKTLGCQDPDIFISKRRNTRWGFRLFFSLMIGFWLLAITAFFYPDYTAAFWLALPAALFTAAYGLKGMTRRYFEEFEKEFFDGDALSFGSDRSNSQ